MLSGCTSPTDSTRGNTLDSEAQSIVLGLEEAVAFTSTRAFPTASGTAAVFNAAEIYLMDPNCMMTAECPRRLTENTVGDLFPALSPNGKLVVFDSNRLRDQPAGEKLNVSDLFLMTSNGSTDQTHLVRGGSPTWSPDGKYIAYHASASGTGQPIKGDPGAATIDSDIFIAKVGELLEGVAEPKNITHDPAAVDDDPDWSPDGRTILFTSHSVADNQINSSTAEIYKISADGSGEPERLTRNTEEERAPTWSPDGAKIAFMCRKGGPIVLEIPTTFEICVMNPDGTGVTRLTDNTMPDLTPTWSLDGGQIMFHRAVAGVNQLFVMNSTLGEDGSPPVATQVTNTAAAPVAGHNLFANWGHARIHFSD
jgi:TolB protein